MQYAKLVIKPMVNQLKNWLTPVNNSIETTKLSELTNETSKKGKKKKLLNYK